MSRVHGITSNGGYSAGAEYSPECPWNQPNGTEIIDVCVSITFHKNIKIEIPRDRDKADINETAYDAIEKEINFLDRCGWFEDDFEAIEE